MTDLKIVLCYLDIVEHHLKIGVFLLETLITSVQDHVIALEPLVGRSDTLFIDFEFADIGVASVDLVLMPL